jgi:K+-transporting ATPase ATPase C chain
MRRQLLTGLIVLVAMTALTGLAYPLVVTGVAQAAFPHEADGSLVEVDGEPVASELVGQAFEGDEWFHPRPSSAGDGYDAGASSGSNLGPTSPELLDAVAERVEAYRTENGLADDAAVPVDAVTGSASGLDPHISLANARLQAPRVAEARDLDLDDLLALVDDHVDDRPLGVLGDAGVNVVMLNLALRTLGP